MRDKLEYAEKILILRWEIISYLLTLIARAWSWSRRCAALSPVGWLAVALALGVLGLLTRQILEEAIGAEDLNKVHLMEAAIASNATLQGSFDQIERLAYRLLDWGDFRVYRVIDRADRRWPTAARSAGPTGASRPTATAPLPARGDRQREPGGRSRTPRRDPRVRTPMPDVGSLVIHPIRFGEELLGTLEVDHPKRHAYGTKDLMALSTLANQIATAIHIAELRRPLLSTVEQIGEQVTALARVDRLAPRSALGAGRRLAGHAAGRRRAGELRRRRAPRPPARSATASRAMADQGAQAAAGERHRGGGRRAGTGW